MYTDQPIVDIYHEWLCNMVFPSDETSISYRNLFYDLDTTPFVYEIPLDENRFIDGLKLRDMFDSEFNLGESVSEILSEKHCTMLEMMVALAYRCEKYIMHDDDYGDRTSLWFWYMVEGLGLDTMDDIHYEYSVVSDAIYDFQNRCVDEYGRGGLYKEVLPMHLGNLNVWQQTMKFLCWYNNERSYNE